MEWNKISNSPKQIGDYLCCGDEHEWNMKDGDPPDTYCIAYFDGERWHDKMPNYSEIELMFWCDLPPLPNQPERLNPETQESRLPLTEAQAECHLVSLTVL